MASDKHLDQNEQLSCLMDNHRTDIGFDANAKLDALTVSGESRDKWERYHLIRDVIQKDYQAPLSTDFASKVSAAIQQEPAIVAFPASASATKAIDQGSSNTGSSVPHQVSSGDDVVSDVASEVVTAQANPASPTDSVSVTDFNDARNKASLASANPSQHNTSNGRRNNWLRNAGGLAIAASVAMVALVGMNVFQVNQGDDASLVAAVGGSASDFGTDANSSSGGASSERSSEIQVGQSRVRVMENGGQIELVSNSGTYWVAAGDNKLSPANETRLNMYLSQHLEASPTAGVQGFLPYSRLAGYDTATVRQQAQSEQ